MIPQLFVRDTGVLGRDQSREGQGNDGIWRIEFGTNSIW
jgi:hypothetical protein